MIIDTDFHSHVSRSSAHEMLQAAQEKGLRILGLSEHIFQMSEARPHLAHLPQEGPFMTFSAYIQAVQALQVDAVQRGSCAVRLGMEVDFIPDKNELIQSYIQAYSWDFLIGSVHEIDGLQYEFEKQWDADQGQTAWLRYFALLRKAVSSGYFSVVSHPVRMRYTNPYLPPTLDEELEALAVEATRCNTALEINGFDVLNYPTLVRRLARACALHQTPISVSSDAHVPKNVAQAHRQSEAILRDAGITKVRTWKAMVAEEYTI